MKLKSYFLSIKHDLLIISKLSICFFSWSGSFFKIPTSLTFFLSFLFYKSKQKQQNSISIQVWVNSTPLELQFYTLNLNFKKIAYFKFTISMKQLKYAKHKLGHKVEKRMNKFTLNPKKLKGRGRESENTYPFQFLLANLLPISIGRVHNFTTLRRLHFGRLKTLILSLSEASLIIVPLRKLKSLPFVYVSLRFRIESENGRGLWRR